MQLNDLTGERFGRLTVVEKAPNKKIGKEIVTMWKCKCDCGNIVFRSPSNLKGAKYPSCGCWKSENTTKRKLIDLTGNRFGMLTVIERAENAKSGLVRWKCKCDCGKECVVIGNNLKRGHTVSCGCEQQRSRIRVKTKHGKHASRIYGVYGKIKDRCTNPNNPSYHRYGGRGITMCKEWMNDPGAFMEWAEAHGYDENAKYGECTVDRIDNSKGYSPDNCRIVNEQVQANNRRTNKYVTYNGESHTVAEWSRILGINKATLNSGLWAGVPFEHYVKDYKPRNTHPKK